MFGCSLVVALALTGGAAYAHVPALETRSAAGGIPLGTPDVSRAVYGYISPSEEHDTYTFTVAAPVTTTFGIIVPAYSEHAGFRPVLELDTPGQPTITVADPGKPVRDTEWEPFSLTTFWKGGEQAVTLQPGRPYTLRVEPGAGAASGRYVIVVGGAERFSGADTLATLRDLPPIWLGMYGGAPPHWNSWALIPAAIVVAALAVLVVLFVRVLKTRRESRA